MITKTSAFKTSTDKTFETIVEAQREELLALILGSSPGDTENVSDNIAMAVDKIMASKDKAIDILTTKENSRPVARKTNGASKKRTPKNPQPELPKS